MKSCARILTFKSASVETKKGEDLVLLAMAKEEMNIVGRRWVLLGLIAESALFKSLVYSSGV
jgi:hypothetical protein